MKILANGTTIKVNLERVECFTKDNGDRLLTYAHGPHTVFVNFDERDLENLLELLGLEEK